MTVDVNDIVRVTAVMDHTLEGTVQNVFWAKQFSEAATDTGFRTNAAARLEIVYGYLTPYMPDTLSFDEIRFFNITKDQPMATMAWPTLVDGDVDVADPLPSVLSCLSFGRTGINRVVQRKFFGPFTEANQADAEWTSALTVACNNAYYQSTVAFGTFPGTAQFGVYSGKLLTWYPIVEWVTRSVIAYQRRRKRGRGA